MQASIQYRNKQDEAGGTRIKDHSSWRLVGTIGEASNFNIRYATARLDEMARRFDTREKRGPVTDLINPDGVRLDYGSPFIDDYEMAETYGKQSIGQPTMKT